MHHAFPYARYGDKRDAIYSETMFGFQLWCNCASDFQDPAGVGFTALGVGLAKCIKTGVDNKGHPMIQTCGVVAGDEQSYVAEEPF